MLVQEMILIFIFALAPTALALSNNERELGTPNAFPIHYDVEITLENSGIRVPATFKGCVRIKITNKNSHDLQHIHLHSKKKFGIQIVEAKIEYKPKLSISKKRKRYLESYDDEKGFLNLTLTNPIKPGANYYLVLKYKGEFNKRYGYIVWRSYHKYVISTNSIYQQLFPCFDDLHMRAAFRIKVSTESNHKAFKDGLFLTYITDPDETSLKLPDATHELGENEMLPPNQIPFVITNIRLDSYSIMNKNGWIAEYRSTFDTRSVVRAGCYDSNRFVTIEDFLFNLKNYTLPKMEIIVIRDNAVNMNLGGRFGLTIISHKYLFTPVHQKRIFNVYIRFTRAIFGGLISADSRKDQWWIDAFAQFLVRVYSGEVIRPLSMWKRPTTNVDHSLLWGVDKFQYWYYPLGKGMLLLRTAYEYLGREEFMKKISEIIEIFRFKSTSPYILFQRFGPVVKNNTQNGFEGSLDLLGIASSYKDHKRYPVVLVYTSGNSVLVNQTRFIGSFDERINAELKKCYLPDISWNIPLHFTTYDFNNGTELDQNNEGFSKSNCIYFPNKILQENEVILMNTKCLGIYRVKYAPSLWTKIVNLLQNYREAVPDVSRGCIVNDALTLAFVGYEDYREVFRMLKFLSKETSEIVWEAFFYAANDLNELLLISPVHGKFQVFLNGIMGHLFNTTYQGHFDTLDVNSTLVITNLTATIYKWGCTLARHPDCRKQAKDKFAYWKEIKGENETIPLPIRDIGDIAGVIEMVNTVFCTILGETDLEDPSRLENMKTLIAWIQQPNFPWEFMDALKCASDENLINSFLDWTVSNQTLKGKVIQQFTFLKLAKGKYTFQYTVRFFKEKVDEIMDYHDREYPDFVRDIVEILLARMTPTEGKELNEYIRKTNRLSTKHDIEKAVETGNSVAQLRNLWKLNYLPSFVNFTEEDWSVAR